MGQVICLCRGIRGKREGQARTVIAFDAVKQESRQDRGKQQDPRAKLLPREGLVQRTPADVGKDLFDLLPRIDVKVVEPSGLLHPLERFDKAADSFPARLDHFFRGANGPNHRVDGPYVVVCVKAQPAAALELVGGQPLLRRQ